MTRISEILNNLFLNLNKPSEVSAPSAQSQLFDFDAGTHEDVVDFSNTTESSGNTKCSSTTLDVPSSILKIKPYTKVSYGTTVDAIKDSQRSLIGLIRFFEGDPKNNYKAKAKYNDNYGKGTTTYGYGIIDPAAIGESTPVNETQAYNMMLKYLDKVAYNDIVNEFRPPADCSKIVAVHVVKKGDTLAKIASKYADITVEDLKRANSGLTNNLTVGQKINIPAKGQPTKETYYASLPQSVREALLDYTFRNGGSTWRANSKKIKSALDKGLQTGNWVEFLSLLTSSQEKKSEGLSRRGFGRTLLAVRDLPKTKALNDYIEKLYNEVLKKSPNYAQDVKDIYDIYKNGKITDPKSPLYNETNKSKSNSGASTNATNANRIEKSQNQETQTTVVTHEVVSGDTLSGLAAKYGTTKKAIMEENGLSTEQINIGQTLKIPSDNNSQPSKTQNTKTQNKNNSTQTHVVKSGDTLSGLAAKYGTTKKAIMEENGLRTEQINIGQTLKIPSDNNSQPSKTQNTKTQNKNNSTQTHVVKSGDTLSELAAKYGTTKKAIMEENGLRTEQINIGQTLKIPSDNNSQPSKTQNTKTQNKNNSTQTHVVKSGDTLSELAVKYGTTKKAIMEENGLRTEQINIGQILKIPR